LLRNDRKRHCDRGDADPNTDPHANGHPDSDGYPDRHANSNDEPVSLSVTDANAGCERIECFYAAASRNR
jgi:hypothetical protein